MQQFPPPPMTGHPRHAGGPAGLRGRRPQLLVRADGAAVTAPLGGSGEGSGSSRRRKAPAGPPIEAPLRLLLGDNWRKALPLSLMFCCATFVFSLLQARRVPLLLRRTCAQAPALHAACFC